MHHQPTNFLSVNAGRFQGGEPGALSQPSQVSVYWLPSQAALKED
jgi:hypothetical protein